MKTMKRRDLLKLGSLGLAGIIAESISGCKSIQLPFKPVVWGKVLEYSIIPAENDAGDHLQLARTGDKLLLTLYNSEIDQLYFVTAVSSPITEEQRENLEQKENQITQIETALKKCSLDDKTDCTYVGFAHYSTAAGVSMVSAKIEDIIIANSPGHFRHDPVYKKKN